MLGICAGSLGLSSPKKDPAGLENFSKTEKKNARQGDLHWHNKCDMRTEMISVFWLGVNEIWALQGYYATQIGSLLLTFRDNPSVQSSMVKLYKKNTSGTPRQLDFLLRFLFCHAPLLLVVSVTFSENHSWPTTFPTHISTEVPAAFFLDFLTVEDGTDGLYRNFKLPIRAA